VIDNLFQSFMTFNQIKEKLKDKTIGIAGCGGLGSNCAVALARVGLGNITIADFDKIEESNLNRQYFFFNQIGMPKAIALKENIFRINPNTNVIEHDIFLTVNLIGEIYKDCDIIVEAFDKAEMKQMILKAVYKHFPDKPLVMGMGLAGWGDNHLMQTNNYGNVFVCGDELNEVSDQSPPLAPRVGIVSNMMANLILELLLGSNEYQKHNRK
jgi:sulfur carrier protein ThiS adenylyltransferase